MIPVYKTQKPEQIVNAMAKQFPRVVVDARYWNIMPIRFRPDLLHGRVYFAKTPSQITQWQNNGGVLVRWHSSHFVGPHDAILYAECPRSIEMLDRYARETSILCVVYQPHSWRPHFMTVYERTKEKTPGQKQTAIEALERVHQLVEGSPTLSPASLARLSRARLAESPQPSSVPELRAISGRSSGTTAGVP